MTYTRRPVITGELFEPSRYTDSVMEKILAKTGLPVVEAWRISDRGSEEAHLRGELHSSAWWYCNHLKVLQKKRQRDKAAWDEYIDRLARAFELAFGRKATGTIDGPFIRFVLAAIKPVGLVDITDHSIRLTLRRNRTKTT